MTAQEIKNKEDKYFRDFLWICLIVVLFVVVAYFSVSGLTRQPTEPGEFGDLFGICTCLFSGLAFSGLLYIVKIQKLELRITRDELIATAEANRITAHANLKNLEVQRLSTIIAGRQAILDVLTGPNERASQIVWDRDSYLKGDEMIRQYALHIKNALNELDRIDLSSAKK